MIKLISGKEACIAYLNGEDVVHINKDLVGNKVFENSWSDCEGMDADDFKNDVWAFQIRPTLISLDILVPEQFTPKEGDGYWYLSDDSDSGYDYNNCYQNHHKSFYGFYKTVEDIEIVANELLKLRIGAK